MFIRNGGEHHENREGNDHEATHLESDSNDGN